MSSWQLLWQLLRLRTSRRVSLAQHSVRSRQRQHLRLLMRSQHHSQGSKGSSKPAPRQFKISKAGKACQTSRQLCLGSGSGLATSLDPHWTLKIHHSGQSSLYAADTEFKDRHQALLVMLQVVLQQHFLQLALAAAPPQLWLKLSLKP